MAAPIIVPSPQFCDANGKPFAGGTIATFIVGTDTPKDSFVDPELTSLNQNPIVLDAAGRCLMWGDGDYRLVLRDANGNLIWDQPSTTIVSAAMAPVVAASTLEEARDLLGITEAIQAETDRATAAESNLQTQITAEVSRATGIENGLRTDLDAEIARAIAREDALEAMIASSTIPSMQTGTGVTDGGTGFVSITYPTPFASTPVVVATLRGSALPAVFYQVDVNATSFNMWTSIPLADDAVHPIAAAFNWIAVGEISGSA